LQITFHDGPGDPCAIGVQGAGDGKGKKLGVLFGFKNGGTGNHRLTYSDGRVLGVASKEMAPSVFSFGDGKEFITVHRGTTSTAVLADGTEAVTFADDAVEAETLELFRLVMTTPAGEDLGRLDVIRRVGGWTLSRALDAAWSEYFWMDHAGQALPIPILGTRLTLPRPLTSIERDVLLGACVDIAMGLRPYATAMQ
jgi:hypothetical protein